MIMKAKKSHYLLLSVSWSPMKAGGVIQSKSVGLRTRGANDKNPNPRARGEKMTCPSSVRQE